MQVYTFHDLRPLTGGTVFTLGVFDGVHLGHQALIGQVVADARAMGCSATLATFHPHPQSVLHGHRLSLLSSLPQRMALFRQLGLDRVALIPFTPDVARMEPEPFFLEYIQNRFALRKLVVGYDFAFGKNRQGHADFFRALAVRQRFDFQVFSQVELDGQPVSSTRIRQALAHGDFAGAERLLGRPYSYLGPVEHGDGRGGKLGFPTLNQPPEEPLPMGFGVFAAWARVGESKLPAVCNYGLRPTFGGGLPVLETHLLDWSGNLYGAQVEVTPVAKLRDERRFASVEALKAQLAHDLEQAKNQLALHSSGLNRPR